MRILFLLGATSRIRNFDHTLVTLADRGHTLRLTGRPRKGVFALPKTIQHERISGAENPTQRSDDWRAFVESIRGARDYVRYLDPRFAQATRLVRRAYEIAPTQFVLFCERHPWVARYWKLVSAALAYCETLIPVDPGFAAFVRQERPDIILVTPLVTFESYQTDYVKAAHRLGIPIAFLPFSWDNLTNKGLMRILPDRVLVWNETQKREAIELHGARPDAVQISGAPRFDDFFVRTPSTSRQEFCAQYDLDPTRPLLLYLGSSQLTGPNEMELVRRWVEEVRGASDPSLREAGILIRPHPALKESWTTVDLSAFGNIGVSLHASRNADQDLFDSLHHAHVAVGLNTSAMLEAGIVGRPVHTLVIPGFDEGQIGTMHFHYLVEAHGGLATVAHDFPEHLRQLAELTNKPVIVSDRSRRFIEGFLRPHGIDTPVYPILADQIERIAEIRKRPQTWTAPWQYPLRALLHQWLSRRWSALGGTEDTTIVGTSMSLRPTKTALEELRHGTAPIFVGPWLDSAASELLYWIPFVTWAAATYGLSRDRMIVVSRGGVKDWYGTLAHRYIDTSSLFSEAEHAQWTSRTIPQSQQNPKQAVMYPFDQEIVERAVRAFDLSDYQILHPLSFFRVLRRLQADRLLPQLPHVLQHERFVAIERTETRQLPQGQVAVSLAFSDALPDNSENRRFLAELVDQLAADPEVIVIDYPVVPMSATTARLRTLAGVANDENYLGVQTAVLAQAEAFVGGYGNLAVLASFCGTPAFTYFSEAPPAEVVDLLHHANRARGWAPVALTSVIDAVPLELPTKVHM